jgi:tetraacyldisaccharide 4'-kinase
MYDPRNSMPTIPADFFHRILDGTERSPGAASLRAITAIAEPFYATVMRTRNLLYSRGTFASHSLHRPTISVGNITTGGTGKTPVVQWLAGRLRDAGRRPAVLLRGYRSTPTAISDEQQVLDRALNSGAIQPIPVRANADRIQAAAQLLREQSGIDTFVLDDAFQHRKVHRDFDLVLISATDPFGFGHVLPRGLLREPLSGLRRANAFLVTRCSLASPAAVSQIHSELVRRQPNAPIYRANHVLKSIRIGDTGERLPMDSLKGKRFYTVCGIANPAALDLQLRSLGGDYAGHEWFPDHHLFSGTDLQRIQKNAVAAGAEQIVTTEKDWVKLESLAANQPGEIPFGVLEMRIDFHEGDDDRLFVQIVESLRVAGAETTNATLNTQHSTLNVQPPEYDS